MGEFEAIRDIANFLDNFEWSAILGVLFATALALFKGKILGGEPDFVPTLYTRGDRLLFTYLAVGLLDFVICLWASFVGSWMVLRKSFAAGFSVDRTSRGMVFG